MLIKTLSRALADVAVFAIAFLIGRAEVHAAKAG